MTRFQSVSYRRFAEGAASREPEPAQIEALIAKARGRARADGFEEGVAHAEAQRDVAQDETLRGIAEALAAIAASRDEMREDAAAATFTAVRDFIAAIAPRLLASGAAEAAAQALTAAVSGAQAPEIAVRVSEGALAETRKCFQAAGVRCALSADADVPAGVARITGGGGFDEIDVRPAVETALEALDRSRAHGHPGASGEKPRPRASTLFNEDSDDG